MSKERDIDDILDSLNQLLREGESHNDDHEDEDISTEEIEAQLHELDEEGGGPESKPVLSDHAAEETGENEADSESESERVSDPAPAGELDGDDELDGEEPEDSPISMQRVVLTEDMLVDNPQGSLLSMISNRASSPDEADVTLSEAQSQDQNGVSHTLLHVDHEHLEQLLEQVADDVINQLQHELPALIKRSLYHHLAAMRDGEQAEPDSGKNSEE